MKIFVAILILTSGLSAQSRIDSLYNKYFLLHQKNLSENLRQRTIDEQPLKCGFGIENAVRLGIKSFSPAQQKVLKTMFIRPELDTSIVSPSGFFRIHFNRVTDAPQYNINDLAKAFDSSYSFEVDHLGFLPPPRDLGNGGDDKYDVYIYRMSRGIYGNTNSEGEISSGSQTFYSYIEMDNSFSGYPTTGILAAKVTAAHELHHAIQIGNYILRQTETEIIDLYFYELTSTSMEEFIYDEINDYYYYLKTGGYFNFTGKAFASNEGYNLAVWNIFLRDKFNYGVIKRQWELMRTYRALEAIDRSLIEEQSSFLDSYNEFGVWTFYTNYRTVHGKYFEEAENYPLIKPEINVNFNKNLTPIEINSDVTSISFVKVVNSLNEKKDTLYFVLSNFEMKSGISDLSKQFNSTITISDSWQNNFATLPFGYYLLFSPDYPDIWKCSSIINYIVYSPVKSIETVFPSPFHYEDGKSIYIPLNGTIDDPVSLKIYSISMDLVCDIETKLTPHLLIDEPVVKWNGLNNKNEKLGSGVYFYLIKSPERTALGKLVILNE